MERSVPLWLVLLLLLLGLLGTLGFGWLVRDALVGSGRSGALGQAAANAAGFPSLASQALRQVQQETLEEERDTWKSVVRPAELDLTGAQPVAAAPGLDPGHLPDGLMLRQTGPVLPGWRVMSGSFVLGGEVENALLLLDPQLRVARALVVGEAGLTGPNGNPPRPKHRKFIHGLEMLPDGSVIFTFDGGMSVQRVDACGRRIWATPGGFTHSVSLSATGESVWVVKNKGFAELAVEDGALLREIHVDAIIAANPEIDILGLRHLHANMVTRNPRNTVGTRMKDTYHFNDADPLPAALAEAYPGFAAGDLLISARALNLVFVLDPETLAIKWWRIGTQMRQHDPDWRADGRISIYDNRMSRDYSQITLLDPAQMQARAEILLDGRQMAFYSRIRGKQQGISNGGIVLSAPQQGRAFEWHPDAGVVAEFFNLKPSDAQASYLISELRLLPEGIFAEGLPACAD